MAQLAACTLIQEVDILLGPQRKAAALQVKMCHTTVEEQLARYLHDKSLLPSAGAADNSLGAQDRELAGSTS